MSVSLQLREMPRSKGFVNCGSSRFNAKGKKRLGIEVRMLSNSNADIYSRSYWNPLARCINV